MFKNMGIRKNWGRPQMYMTTEQANKREEILFGGIYDHQNYEMGGIRSFFGLTPEDALSLVRLKFLDENDCQNESPPAKDFIRFCIENGHGWSLHGYSVSPTREDCRVTIEGVECHRAASNEEKEKFLSAFRFADDLRVNDDSTCYCWYD